MPYGRRPRRSRRMEPGGRRPRRCASCSASPTPPTAVFAANDLMAIGAMDAIRERRCRFRAIVALVGYDDIEAAALVQPRS